MSARAVVRSVVAVLLVQMLPLLVSWRWGWVEAWVYLAVQTGAFALGRAVLYRRHPDLFASRADALAKTDAKPWDRRVVLLMVLASTSSLVVAGLEARARTGPVFSLTAKVIAALFVAAGDAFGTWALLENRYFEGLVRIQRDRGHVVVSSGPYAIVRHPGYLGALVANGMTPVLLDAPWSAIAVGLSLAALVYRTAREDQTLRAELEGYEDFTTRTRYRLIPGVW